MRHVRNFFILTLVSFFAVQLSAAETRIIKVLPHYLDAKGRHTLSPSLYERDAYQKILRENEVLRSALRFDVHFKNPRKSESLKLKIEVRAVKGQELVTESNEAFVKKLGWMRTWSSVSFSGKQYKHLGEISAWRATLWNGDQQIAEQKSFLW